MANRKLRRLRRLSDGSVAYIDSSFLWGFLFALLGATVLVVGIQFQKTWSGTSSVWQRGEFDPITDAPPLAAVLLGAGMILGGLVVLPRRLTAIFDPKEKRVEIRRSGILGTRRRSYDYGAVRVELRRLTVSNHRGIDWRGYVLKLLWPEGRHTLCSSVGPMGGGGKMRMIECAERFQGLTGLHYVEGPEETSGW